MIRFLHQIYASLGKMTHGTGIQIILLVAVSIARLTVNSIHLLKQNRRASVIPLRMVYHATILMPQMTGVSCQAIMFWFPLRYDDVIVICAHRN